MTRPTADLGCRWPLSTERNVRIFWSACACRRLLPLTKGPRAVFKQTKWASFTRSVSPRKLVGLSSFLTSSDMRPRRQLNVRSLPSEAATGSTPATHLQPYYQIYRFKKTSAYDLGLQDGRKLATGKLVSVWGALVLCSHSGVFELTSYTSRRARDSQPRLDRRRDRDCQAPSRRRRDRSIDTCFVERAKRSSGGQHSVRAREGPQPVACARGPGPEVAQDDGRPDSDVRRSALRMGTVAAVRSDTRRRFRTGPRLACRFHVSISPAAAVRLAHAAGLAAACTTSSGPSTLPSPASDGVVRQARETLRAVPPAGATACPDSHRQCKSGKALWPLNDGGVQRLTDGRLACAADAQPATRQAPRPAAHARLSARQQLPTAADNDSSGRSLTLASAVAAAGQGANDTSTDDSRAFAVLVGGRRR